MVDAPPDLIPRGASTPGKELFCCRGRWRQTRCYVRSLNPDQPSFFVTLDKLTE